MLASVQNFLLSCVSWGVSSFLLTLTTALIGYVIYRYLTADNWEKYGVKQVPMNKETFIDFNEGITKMMEVHGPTFGLTTTDMFLVTRDLELLKKVLVKDFNNFVNRKLFLMTNSCITKGLFFLSSQDWRRVRHILTPSFSTGKLKVACKSIEDSSAKLGEVLERYAKEDKLLEVKPVTGQYTSEIIARTAFGIKTDCIGQEDGEFTQYSKTIFKIRNRITNTMLFILFQMEWLHEVIVKKLKILFWDQVNMDAETYFESVLKSSIADRHSVTAKGGKNPDDFLQSLIVAKAAGEEAQKSASPSDQSTDSDKTLSDEELQAQSMLIIFAGFETTSTTLHLMLYLLAKHPDIQEKVYQEIKTVLADENPTYEELGNLKYMEQVINETLRMYPPVPIVTRIATEEYVHNDIIIPKGAVVTIPLGLIMKDPKNFPDPHKFDPERFSEENSAKIDPITFVPFGYGPRLCIGKRLALLELKMGLVQIIKRVKVELNDRTEPQKGKDIKTMFQGFIIVEKPIQLCLKLRK